MISVTPVGAEQTHLNGVSCPDATSCFAVGDFNGTTSTSNTLVDHRDGTTWTIQTSSNPTGSTNTQLWGVSCPSTTSCFAVGSYETAGIGKSLVERWDGLTWKIMTSPNPTASVDTILSGVSCPTTTSCFGVGNYATGTATNTLIEHWGPTNPPNTWKIMTSPNLMTLAATTNLGGVSCPSTTSCYAVGVLGLPSGPWRHGRWQSIGMGSRTPGRS